MRAAFWTSRTRSACCVGVSIDERALEEYGANLKLAPFEGCRIRNRDGHGSGGRCSILPELAGRIMPRVFISYARHDVEQIDRLAARLAAVGHTVFVDRDSIVAGDPWRNRIVEAIDGADIVLVALSSTSVVSPQVRREMEIAQERKAPIVPVTIEPVAALGELRYHLSGLQRIDLATDFEAGMADLLHALRLIARRAGIDPDADDPELKAPLDAILADPELSTQEEIRRWMDVRREQLETSPSRRREKELEERIVKIDQEIASIYAQSPARSHDQEDFTPYFMATENSLMDFEKDRLSMLRRERREIWEERLRLIEASSRQGYDAAMRAADSFRQRYDRIIDRIVQSTKPDDGTA